MIDLEINNKNLSTFLDNLRTEDKKELAATLGSDYKDEFIKTCKKISGIYFLGDIDNSPVAIGGAFKIKNENEKQKIAQVWLLCTNRAQRHKFSLYKYVRNKIEIFKKENNILYNFIYKTNFNSLIWLKKCGFRVKNTKNPDYKLFYFNKGGKNFDL